MCGGIVRGAEAVHQHEHRHFTSCLRAQAKDLTCDQIEEGILATHGEQGLGFLQSHAGAEAAIEFEQHCLL